MTPALEYARDRGMADMKAGQAFAAHPQFETPEELSAYAHGWAIAKIEREAEGWPVPWDGAERRKS